MARLHKGFKSALANVALPPSAKRDKRNTKFSREHTAHNSRKTSGGKLKRR